MPSQAQSCRSLIRFLMNVCKKWINRWKIKNGTIKQFRESYNQCTLHLWFGEYVSHNEAWSNMNGGSKSSKGRAESVVVRPISQNHKYVNKMEEVRSILNSRNVHFHFLWWYRDREMGTNRKLIIEFVTEKRLCCQYTFIMWCAHIANKGNVDGWWCDGVVIKVEGLKAL